MTAPKGKRQFNCVLSEGDMSLVRALTAHYHISQPALVEKLLRREALALFVEKAVAKSSRNSG